MPSNNSNQQLPATEANPVYAPRIRVEIDDPFLRPSIRRWTTRTDNLERQFRDAGRLIPARDLVTKLSGYDASARENILEQLDRDNDNIRRDALQLFWDNQALIQRADDMHKVFARLARQQQETSKLHLEQGLSIMDRLLYLGIQHTLSDYEARGTEGNPIDVDEEVDSSDDDNIPALIPLEPFNDTDSMYSASSQVHTWIHRDGRRCSHEWEADYDDQRCRACQDLIARRIEQAEIDTREVYAQMADSDQSR